MIMLDSGGVGEVFQSQVSRALLVAQKTKSPVCFMFNMDECYKVHPASTLDSVEAERGRQAEAKSKLLHLSIVKHDHEDDQEFIERGLTLAEVANAKVVLQYHRTTEIAVFPWFEPDLALELLWRQWRQQSTLS